MSDSLKQPYKTLGLHIKLMRQSRHESLDEVSGSLEMDVDMLQHIEQGLVRPSQETLELIMRHFDLSDKEAHELWSIAGYDNHHNHVGMDGMEELLTRQLMVVLPLETRIIYSDNLQIEVNKNDVIFSFLQQSATGKPQIVSRVGMNKELAKTLLDGLKRTLQQQNVQQKLLPPDSNHKDTTK